VGEMKVELVNDFGFCEELPLKNKVYTLSTYLNYIKIEVGSESIEDIVINDEPYEYKKDTTTLLLPCYFTLENTCTVQLSYNKQKIRYLFKYSISLEINKKTIESLADFHRRTMEWLGEGVHEIDKLISGINDGKINLLHILDPLTGFDDQSILDDIKNVLPFALNICTKPRQHLRVDEEILDVELVKRIRPAALQYLASHSEHWMSRTVTGLIPSRLKAEVYEDDINIYENIFFRMVINHLQTYLSLKDDEVRKAIAQKSSLIDWEQYGKVFKDYKRTEILNRLLPKYDFDTEELKRLEFEELMEKLFALEKQLSSIISTGFYQGITKYKTLPLPIQPTNIIRMDNRYNEIFILWNKLVELEKIKNTQQDITGATNNDVTDFYLLYVQVVLLYSFNLLGYNAIKESKIICHQNGYVSVDAYYRDSNFDIHCSTNFEKDVYSYISIEFVERLNHKAKVPRIFELSDYIQEFEEFCELSPNDPSILIFKQRPSLDTQKMLNNIYKKARDENPTISREMKHKIEIMDKEWRKFLSNEWVKLKEPRSHIIKIYPLLSSIGNDGLDLKKNSESIFNGSLSFEQDSLNSSVMFLMPTDIYKFEGMKDNNLIYRILNYGESYNMNDASKWGNYKVGLLPISQTEINSTQRLMKLVSLHLNKLSIEWGIATKECPSCGSNNIEKIDSNTWTCKNNGCRILWGKTKCTSGCQEEYEWIRPSMEITNLDLDTLSPFEILLKKESIFDRLTITDFELFSENSSVRYLPKCPKCGSTSLNKENHLMKKVVLN
jgi:hypothetical protein